MNTSKKKRPRRKASRLAQKKNRLSQLEALEARQLLTVTAADFVAGRLHAGRGSSWSDRVNRNGTRNPY